MALAALHKLLHAHGPMDTGAYTVACGHQSLHGRMPDAMQLATIKAKSEALRLRQEFELEKFRVKYRSAADAGDSPEHAARTADAAAKGAAAGAGVADEERLGLGTSSDGSLSIGVDEAFDEPLKVRSLLMHDRSHACL